MDQSSPVQPIPELRKYQKIPKIHIFSLSNSLSFPILGGRDLTRALQSTPFQNPGGWWSERDERTEILVSNIGYSSFVFFLIICSTFLNPTNFAGVASFTTVASGRKMRRVTMSSAPGALRAATSSAVTPVPTPSARSALRETSAAARSPRSRSLTSGTVSSASRCRSTSSAPSTTASGPTASRRPRRRSRSRRRRRSARTLSLWTKPTRTAWK